MFILYDINHNKITGLKNYKDYNIERDINQLDILSFLYPIADKNHNSIKEECYIRTKENEYVVKEVNYSDENYDQYICKVNTETIQGTPVSHFETVEQSCANAVNLALAGTGWTIGTCNVTKSRTTRKNNCSSYDVLHEIQTTYGCEMTFDAINKKVDIYQSMGTDKGTYFSDQLNIKKIDTQSSSYDYITRLIALGKDGLDITSVNGGKNYVENYQYSSKVLTAYWEDNRYTVAQNLKDDAIERLDYLSKPLKAYKADVYDLANISDKYKNILDYNLGDTITLLSKGRKVKEKQRIVKLTEYPDEPERNTVEIANKIASLDDLNVRFENTSDTVDDVTTSDGGLDGSKVDSIDAVTQIQNLDSEVARITNLTVINANIDNLFANKANVNDLSAVTARIGTLEATTAKITDLTAINANIENLTANKADVIDLTASNAKITTLEATAATIQTQLSNTISTVNLNATNITAANADIQSLKTGKADIADLTAATGRITNLESSKANITDLTATNANITNLTSNVATIQTLVNGNITSANMAAGAIAAGNAVIANGAIGDAMIASLSVSKLLAGNISTNKFVVQSDSGNLKIQGNTLKAWDTNGKERISLGLNGSDYNLLVRGTDGTTVLFGTTGVTNAGITTGAVDDSKVAVGANINGGKIEKESLISTINGATATLKGSKVKLDTENQTLDIAFTSLKSTVTSTTNTVSSHGTSISTIQGQITSKIWQTDITTAVDNVSVGGRNLLKGTKDFNSSWSKSSSTIDNMHSINGNSSLKISKTGATSNTFAGANQDLIFDSSMIGKNYILSLYVYCEDITTIDSGAFARIWFNGDSNTYIDMDLMSGIQNNKWIKYTKSFTTPLNSNELSIALNIRMNGILWLSSPKLEEGTKATDWTPSPEDFDDKITTINSNYSTLTQTVSGISSSVGSLSSSLDTTNGNVTSVNNNVSTLTQTVNGLSTSVTSIKTDYLKKADASTTYATTTSVSSLSQTVSSLSSTISNVQTSVNNIQIGGTNLVLNGAFTSLANWDSASSGLGSDFVTGTNALIYNSNYIKLDNISTAEKYIYQRGITLKPNTTYTASFYVNNNMSGNSATGDLYVLGQKTANLGGTGFDYTHGSTGINSCDWTKKSFTFTTASDELGCCIRLDNNGSTSGSIRFTLIKLEEGNKATDWSPASADLQGQINSTNTSVSTLSQTVGSLSSTISNVKTDYLKKADASTTYATSSTVSTLSQSLSGLSSTVSTVQSTVSSQGSTISSHTSSISSLNSGIALKLDSTTFTSYKSTNDSAISSINSQLSSHSSSITVLQNSITSKVSQTDIDNSINSMQIGGRNLLKNTGNFKDLTNWSLSMGSGETGSLSLYSDSVNGNVVHGVKTNNISWWVLANNALTTPNGKFTVGQTYTLSFMALSTGATNIGVNFMDGSGINNVMTKSFTLSTSWNKYSCTFTPTITGNIPELYITISTTGEIFIDNIKLEVGSKATDWSPAPEDVQGQIDSATSRISTAESSITQLNNSISLKVSTTDFTSYQTTVSNNLGTKANQSSLNTTNSNLTSLTTRVSTAESSISVLNNSITSKVSYTDMDKTIGSIGGANLIPDASFENEGVGWDNGGQIVADGHYGAHCVRWQNGNGVKTLKNPISVVPGRKYRISFWYSTSSDNNGTDDNQKLRIGNADNNSLLIGIGTGANATSWTKKSMEWTVPNGVYRIILSISSNLTVGWIRYDDLEMLDISDIDGLDTRISTAESSITQLSTSITSKVDVNGVISTIQQNADAVQYAFNNINSAKVTIDTTGLHVTGGSIDGATITSTASNSKLTINGASVVGTTNGVKGIALGWNSLTFYDGSGNGALSGGINTSHLTSDSSKVGISFGTTQNYISFGKETADGSSNNGDFYINYGANPNGVLEKFIFSGNFNMDGYGIYNAGVLSSGEGDLGIGVGWSSNFKNILRIGGSTGKFVLAGDKSSDQWSDFYGNINFQGWTQKSMKLDTDCMFKTGDFIVRGGHVTSFAFPNPETYLNVADDNGHNYGISIYSSDITLKTNIADSSVNALETVKSMRFRQFIWKDSGKIQKLGVVAQELQQLEDSLVLKIPQPDGSVRMQPDETVLIPYLGKAIQELSSKIDDLQQQITELQIKQAS